MAATTTRPSGFPPGPPLPRLVQTLGFIFAPGRFLDACRQRYGDVVTFGTLFDPRFVMVFEPEGVKQVFRGPADQLHAGEADASSDRLSARARCCCSTVPSTCASVG